MFRGRHAVVKRGRAEEEEEVEEEYGNSGSHQRAGWNDALWPSGGDFSSLSPSSSSPHLHHVLLPRSRGRGTNYNEDEGRSGQRQRRLVVISSSSSSVTPRVNTRRVQLRRHTSYGDGSSDDDDHYDYDGNPPCEEDDNADDIDLSRSCHQVQRKRRKITTTTGSKVPAATAVPLHCWSAPKPKHLRNSTPPTTSPTTTTTNTTTTAAYFLAQLNWLQAPWNLHEDRTVSAEELKGKISISTTGSSSSSSSSSHSHNDHSRDPTPTLQHTDNNNNEEEDVGSYCSHSPT